MKKWDITWFLQFNIFPIGGALSDVSPREQEKITLLRQTLDAYFTKEIKKFLDEETVTRIEKEIETYDEPATKTST